MSDRIPFDEILELTNDERQSHLARMIAIRKICVKEIDKVTAATTKRPVGRPPKAKDDGPETRNTIQDENPPPPGPAAA